MQLQNNRLVFRKGTVARERRAELPNLRFDFLNSRKNTKYLGRAIKLLESWDAVEYHGLRQNWYDYGLWVRSELIMMQSVPAVF